MLAVIPNRNSELLGLSPELPMSGAQSAVVRTTFRQTIDVVRVGRDWSGGDVSESPGGKTASLP